MKNKKYFIAIIGIGILIKVFLFCFALIYAPQSKFMNDSSAYLKTAEILMSQGTFAIRDANGSLNYELRITPGYPLFLGILNGLMKIPFSGVIFIQVLLTILTALILYKAAVQIEPKLAFLSAVIALYSPVISIFSLMILTESLFLFLITLFMFYFVKYLQNGKTQTLILSALMLVFATYVRPGAYFLGGIMALFIIYANVNKNIKKSIVQAIVLLIVVYGLLGLWQVRNYLVSGHAIFCSILHDDPARIGLYKSYLRNTDAISQGMSPVMYYIDVTWRCFLSIMTRPGSFKYFHCPTLTVLQKTLAYPWMVFWMTGLLYGVIKMGRNIYYQFFLLVIMYFVSGSIVAEMWFVGERYRVPIVPFIAVFSSYGWMQLILLIKKKYGRSLPTMKQRCKNFMNKIFNIKRFLLAIFLVLIIAVIGLCIWIQGQYVVPILMYHSVSLADESPMSTISPKNFFKQMSFLKRNGYQVITLDDLIEGIKAKKKFSHKTVVITFDDGYQDNYRNAFPFLKEYHFPAAIFLISDATGVSPNLLTWDQVKEMSQYDITFGSHTRRHVYLPEQSEAQLKNEIEGSKRIIEEHLGKPVYYFAYPSGGFSEHIKSLVAMAGYEAALTTNRGYDRYNIDLYELSRIRINNWDSSLVLWSKLSGYYNLFRKLRPSH